MFFFLHNLWQEFFRGAAVLGHSWPFTTCSTFHHSLLAFTVSTEKSSLILKVVPLCYLWCFPFSFSGHSLFYPFNISVIMCYGEFPLCSSLHVLLLSIGVCLSLIQWPSTVFVKIWSMPFYWLDILSISYSAIFWSFNSVPQFLYAPLWLFLKIFFHRLSWMIWFVCVPFKSWHSIFYFIHATSKALIWVF